MCIHTRTLECTNAMCLSAHEMSSLYTSRRDVAQIAVPPTSFFPFLTSLKRNLILSSIGVDLTLCVEAGFFQLS